MQVWMIDAVNMTPYYNASLCRALLDEGCSVTMMTSPFIYDPWPIYRGVRTEIRFSRFLEYRPLLRLARSGKIRRMLRALEYPVDLLQTFVPPPECRPILHFQWSALPALDAWVWECLARARHPLIFTAHDILPPGAKQPTFGQEQLYAVPDRIIVHSPSLARQVQTLFPETADRIRVVPMGLHFADVPEMPRGSARKALDLPQDAPVALFFGLIEPYKGVESLLRAFAQVLQTIPNAVLLVVGKPNVSIEPLNDLIASMKISEATRTYFQFVPTEQAAMYFGASNVVVLPYLEASQSAVLLAAYRFGRAVVVTDTGGLPDTVEHGQNGYVVPPGDEKALAGAIIEVLANPDRTQAMGDRSRQLGLERHNWMHIARQTMAIYREVGAE